MNAAQVQSEFEKFRQILLDQSQERHTQAGKKVAALLLETDSAAELDAIVNILAESALDSVVLNREDARKFYIAEAQKALNRIIEEIK